jgi:uncharacterized membrane protein
MSIPDWALTLAYWLHMLATVVWIGGLTALALLVVPAARQALEPEAYADLLESLQRRLDPVGWFCLAALVATGMFQMSANPNYEGLLAIANRWAVAILIKHLLFLVMIGLSAYSTWVLFPQMRRAALRLAKSPSDDGAQAAARLQRQEINLMRLNLALGILILALTAAARVAA